MSRAAAAVTAVLGSAPVSTAFRLALRGRLRVLAYHDVRDAAAFAEHVEHVRTRYRPVTDREVVAATAGRRLPDRAVWLTFDDAHPDVVELALPLLRDAGVPATLFVCPAVVDTDRPYWWQVVDAAVAAGLHAPLAHGRTGAQFRADLKTCPDAERRSTVDRLAAALDEAGLAARRTQVTTAQLRSWRDAGLGLGNHSWDHPLLDRCDPAAQRMQVSDAHAWFTDALGLRPDLFAYPNGNQAAGAREELGRLRYAPPLLFDHATARLPDHAVSRLRLDAWATPARMRAVVSGAHSSTFAAARRVRRG